MPTVHLISRTFQCRLLIWLLIADFFQLSRAEAVRSANLKYGVLIFPALPHRHPFKPHALDSRDMRGLVGIAAMGLQRQNLSYDRSWSLGCCGGIRGSVAEPPPRSLVSEFIIRVCDDGHV